MEVFEEGTPVKICAPMVRYSKLAFRNLVRLYDCDLAFSPMILADSFYLSQKARDNEFTTNEEDKPLIVQFAANKAEYFSGSAERWFTLVCVGWGRYSTKLVVSVPSKVGRD
eukprot:TRINITY_DN2661_c1_g1_i1.p1 TRINITY_DN2661_c1_g1~~TRINITY_DN2661_c1_g1_i1.p1  ORF type:complete len:112 (+),score=11.23 TRINITY_DN2661_c1_g1_i1:136-471(+)